MARLSRWIEWRAAVLAVLLLIDAAAMFSASSLPPEASAAHAAHRGELLVVSAAWALMAAVVAIRRQLRQWEATTVLVLAAGLIAGYGTLVPDVQWKWQCIATLPLVAALGRMHHRGWWLVAIVVVSEAMAAVLLLQLDLPGAYFAYSVSVVAIIVAAPAVVVAAVAAALDRARAEAERTACTDALTGMLNRRGLTDHVPRLLHAAVEYERDVAVLLLDLDHFKRVNDTWGHTSGDRLLQAVGSAVRAELRRDDLLARWGGEELLVITLVPDTEHLASLAERIRGSVGNLVVAGLPPVTVSIGTASLEHSAVAGAITRTREGDSAGVATAVDLAASLVDRADEALYAAKAAGRDRVHHFVPSSAATLPTPRSHREHVPR